MNFEVKSVSQPVAIFVILVSAFMSGFGVYMISLVNADSYLFVLPFSLIFLPWLPLWLIYLITAKAIFTADRVIKTSFFGKREMKKEAIQFFGIFYSSRFTRGIIGVEDAFEFGMNAKCQICLSEKTASTFRQYPLATMKFPFQRDLYDKIKIWLES